jgi:hypothetical protein
MPVVMDNPFPIEFTEGVDTIVLQLEIWDIVRTIYMSTESADCARRLAARILRRAMGRQHADRRDDGHRLALL